MKFFSTQKLEIQIPEETTYKDGYFMPKNDNQLEQFLKDHFEFPSDNLNEIQKFVAQDDELEKIIYDLPQIVSNELTYNKISFDFMKETDSTEKILEIIIYSELESKILLQKEDLICNLLIDRYPKTLFEYIILVDPYER
ncbi:hypothetical protein [Methanobrevibacter sp.]|uniref:hypothetical protein n=1 Tax=Methanobrevibacter sp. TaxID=66852 RepID=UPI0038643E0A